MKTKKDKHTSDRNAKELFSVRISSEVLQAAKRVAYWTPGMTLGGLVEEAIRREVARLEKAHGKPFPEMNGKIGRAHV